MVTREVLKACNMIRPSASQLAAIPKARRQADEVIKAEIKEKKLKQAELE